MALILVALSLAYGIPILLVALGHARIRQKVVSGTLPELTVLVAARNESEHIEACLRAILAQDIPVHVLVVDDHSDDDTARRVEAFGARVRLIRLEGSSGKKAAISEAVHHIHTDWVLLTDADTLVPPGWARAMAACMTHDCGYVVGPVRLQERRGLFHRMIQLEWAGFMGIARGSIGLGRPTSACGSSVAFRVEAFQAVGGYEGVDHFASGDDEFLMQRIADRTRWSVSFCADPGATVEAESPATASAFVRQRIRWASKAGHYERLWHVAMNVGIWLFFLLLAIGTVGAFFRPAWLPWVMTAWGIKMLGEGLLLAQSVWFYRRPWLMLVWIPAQLFHILYVLALSAAGVRGGVEWKSRSMTR